MNRRKPNALLIELVIVILFFAISASVILQVFVAARDRSVQSSTDTSALLMAEDIAEQFAASPLDPSAFLASVGFSADDDAEAGYSLTRTAANGRDLTLLCAPESEETDAGTLDSMLLTVMDGSRAAVTLPIKRYLPKEVLP